MKLVDKDAVMAIIKNHRSMIAGIPGHFNESSICNEILVDIDTLEAKEVDFEEEFKKAIPPKYCWSGDGIAVYSKQQMKNCAKHFFELGLKAQQ